MLHGSYPGPAMITYSGRRPGGMTILIASEMRLYFIILSLEVVEERDGEAFTYMKDKTHSNNKNYTNKYSIDNNQINIIIKNKYNI